jgi:dienelactone hydrolase
MQALPDLEAALAWAKTQHGGKPVLVWGSSYSAALGFLLAARHPKRIAGILAFSPGEYLRKTPQAVSKAAAQVKVPVFIMTPTKETKTIAPILAALKGKDVTTHVLDTAVHGSSALIEKRCPKAADHWPLVEAFLKRFPLHATP